VECVQVLRRCTCDRSLSSGKNSSGLSAALQRTAVSATLRPWLGACSASDLGPDGDLHRLGAAVRAARHRPEGRVAVVVRRRGGDVLPRRRALSACTPACRQRHFYATAAIRTSYDAGCFGGRSPGVARADLLDRRATLRRVHLIERTAPLAITTAMRR
jgi:hypothetical protein